MRVVNGMRRFGVLHPQVLDTAIALVMYAGVLLAQRFHYATDASPPQHTSGIALAALAILPLALRRRAPLITLALCATGSVLFISAGQWEALVNFGVLTALYSVAASRSRQVSVPSAVLCTGVLCYGSFRFIAGPAWLMVLLAGVFTGITWSLGDVGRLLAERTARLVVLTGELRRSRAEQAQRAVTQERMRIARELHDVLAHHMAVISVQSGLARYVLDSDPPTAATALRTIAATSSEVLDEMRRLLTVLRLESDPGSPDGIGQLGPAPGMDRVGELLTRVRTAGVPVELEVTGTARPLTPGLSLCVYRILQESLTNVLKHAPGAQTTVTLDYGGNLLVAQIANDRGAPVTTQADQGGGHGLIGMRERARLYGGTVSAAATANGGYTVVLTLPLGSTV
jgi:signal transduction histidine kinase